MTTHAPTLVVRGVPIYLSTDTVNEFFTAFQAIKVQRTKYATVFVSFKDEAAMSSAAHQLAQTKLLGKTLLVERVKGKPKEDPFPVAKNLGIDFPAPPHLLYKYPPPNQTILNNIRNALLSVPVFYTQVLHLMNKMNIPPPFQTDGPSVNLIDPRRRKRKRASSDSSNSELDSDSEEERKKEKKRKLQEMVDSLKDRTRIQIRHEVVPIFGPTGSVHLSKGPPIISVTPKAVKEPKHFQVEEIKRNDHLLRCASSQKIEANRVPLSSLEKFKNHDAGAMNRKVYIKNLPKSVKEEDFYYIFGKWFPDDEVMKSNLQIQIMGGKMRGQAFITFPNRALAVSALEEVNGYVLDGKPMVMSYAKAQLDDPEEEADAIQAQAQPEVEVEVEDGVEGGTNERGEVREEQKRENMMNTMAVENVQTEEATLSTMTTTTGI